MVLQDDSDLEQRYNDLCSDLNMDQNTKEESWHAYENIRSKYSLEGEQLHWLAVALWSESRMTVLSTVDNNTVQGNCVSLTRLLRSSKLGESDFFRKMHLWADMTSMPQDFRAKMQQIERSFDVTFVIYKKYQCLFLTVFQKPIWVQRVQTKGRKLKLPCTANDVYQFCWSCFCLARSKMNDVQDDLVSSYHLLICCIDWLYLNSIFSSRTDLINPSFRQYQVQFMESSPGSISKKHPDDFNIVHWLCSHYDGIGTEAYSLRTQKWLPFIYSLFEKGHLRGNLDTLMGILEQANFEFSRKQVNKLYDEYVLTKGDIDDRNFAHPDTELQERSQGPPNAVVNMAEVRRTSVEKTRRMVYTHTLQPKTPLTGRRYMKEAAKTGSETPVSTATQTVNKLHSLLAGEKPSASENLLEIFEKCQRNPKEFIEELVDNLSSEFCKEFGNDNFAIQRIQLAKCLFYKILLGVMRKEKEDLTAILEKETFHKCLFACAVEVVLFSYNSQKTYPWVIETFELAPFNFYKVIELVIRAEDQLSREMVKHLNRIEESVLESGSWSYNSPLWRYLDKSPVPKCEEVMLPAIPDPPAPKKVTETRLVANDKFASPHAGMTPGRGNDTYKLVTTKDGRRLLVPVQLIGRPITTTKPVVVSTDVKKEELDTSVKITEEDVPLIPMKEKEKRTGSIALFFRKIYYLACMRLRDLCERLKIDDDLRAKMWTTFEYMLTKHVEVMKDRHIDQMIMCTIYAVAKVTGCSTSFQDIMTYYRLQPQAESHVYRSVLLSRRATSGSSEDDEPDKKKMRSNSTLPAPSSAPPTPTKLTGISSAVFDRDERGDIIRFYNAVFVSRVKEFAVKFSPHISDTNSESIPITPLPTTRPFSTSPRRVGNQKVYVSPIKQSNTNNFTPRQTLFYHFHTSPARDLAAINDMLLNRMNAVGTTKRNLREMMDKEEEPNPVKLSAIMTNKLMNR